MELSFYPSEELVQELLSRITFAGIILKPRDPVEEIQSDPIIQFDMYWSPRLPNHTVKKLLETAMKQLEANEA